VSDGGEDYGAEEVTPFMGALKKKATNHHVQFWKRAVFVSRERLFHFSAG